jgi:hypothetical protein
MRATHGTIAMSDMLLLSDGIPAGARRTSPASRRRAGIDGFVMPATQHDVVLWLSGSAYDGCSSACLRSLFESSCFIRWNPNAQSMTASPSTTFQSVRMASCVTEKAAMLLEPA